MGYFYHPRFILYRALVSGALKQEQYEQSSFPPLGWRNGNAFEYDVRVYVLPEHPYNLELFATRYEPLFRQEFVNPADTTSTSLGADFRYRRKPWFVHARAEEDGFDTAGVLTTVRLLNVDGKYFKEYTEGRRLSLEASYTPSRLTDSLGFASDTASASFSNTLESRRFQLLSNVSLDDLNQNGRGGATLQAKSRMFSWYEQFTANLPYNLRADAIWRYQDNDSEYGATPQSRTMTISNVHKGGEFDLRHQLYESLQTTYALRWDSSSSSSGETTSLSNSLNFSYTKRIDGVRGRLMLGLNLSGGDTQNTGQLQVVDEPHPGVPVPGAFLLQQPGADPASVVVFARSPQPPFDLVQLTEGANYTVTTVGNSLQITILSLPAEFPVPGKYDFRVSYALLSGDFKARIRAFGQNGSFALFDDLLTPYYTYAAVKSEVLSGTYPGGGIDSQVFTAGLSFLKGPWRARVEYGDVRWATSPWHGWKGEVQFTGPVGRSTNLNGLATYQVQNFEGTEGTGGLAAYKQTGLSASGNVQQFLVARTLSLSGGASYSRITGLSDSRSYSLNATLSWKIGKLDLSGGATYSNAETQNVSFYTTRTVRQYYYLRLRRLLF
ncbi:MAG TPA: hypothetical protein PK598_01360 [Thermoanaerobaculia bacterium]|nr:hypothetical protein [Thermoanaerobaculia bacterium]